MAKFANVLAGLDIGRGDRVFALLGRVVELYVAALGTLANGSVFCPLFSAFGPEPILERLRRGDGKLLVTNAALYARKVAFVRDQAPALGHVLLTEASAPATTSLAAGLAEASESLAVAPTDPEDMALLHFTSGTTGKPKGAVHVHGAVVAHYATARFALDLRPDDVFWCTADPGWVTGTSYGIIAPLVVGATMIVDEREFDADRWYGILQDQGVTVWYTAPTAIRMMMKVGAEVTREYRFDRLRFMASPSRICCATCTRRPRRCSRDVDDVSRGDPRGDARRRARLPDGRGRGPVRGTYGVTKRLLDELGPKRIRDTPLSESGFVGAGIGAALGGMRPIVEIMTVNFSLLALDQIVNNAALLRHMSGGQLSVPIVIRMATGAGRQLAAQHSHSLENWYAHVPGLKVVMPATITDARYVLRLALADPDPVVIFEHVMLYNAEGEVEDADAVDLLHAAVRRPGKDATVITYGGCVPKALAAAEQLTASGVDVEVVDLRMLRPLDVETFIASVRRTRRAVVVEEAWRTGGLAAEIAALIAEHAIYELDAPVLRVCSEEVPIPYPKHLEDAALPQIPDIVAAVEEVMRP